LSLSVSRRNFVTAGLVPRQIRRKLAGCRDLEPILKPVELADPM
jgi:hypothetical protein